MASDSAPGVTLLRPQMGRSQRSSRILDMSGRDRLRRSPTEGISSPAGAQDGQAPDGAAAGAAAQPHRTRDMVLTLQ